MWKYCVEKVAGLSLNCHIVWFLNSRRSVRAMFAFARRLARKRRHGLFFAFLKQGSRQFQGHERTRRLFLARRP
jgi:hypothetical protein